jgi:hypothetical protein
MTPSNKRDKKEPPIGVNLPDPFFNSYNEEMLTCYDILNEAGMQGQAKVTVTFERAFLKRIVHSHITFIQNLSGTKIAHRY